MAKSISHQRRTEFYPDPKYKRLLEDLAKTTGESKSSIVNRAVRELIDKKQNK
jgi:hypothetical protein